MAEQPGDTRPIPDPTELTTQAVDRAKEIFEREMQGLRELMECRMDGMDKLERQKLAGIEHQFETIEQQRIEQKKDMKDAVDAALASQKEAVAKSEASTKEQLEQLATTFQTVAEGQRRDIDEIKGRLTTVEATKIGGQEATEGMSRTTGLAIAAVGVVIAVLSIVAAMTATGP